MKSQEGLFVLFCLIKDHCMCLKCFDLVVMSSDEEKKMRVCLCAAVDSSQPKIKQAVKLSTHFPFCQMRYCKSTPCDMPVVWRMPLRLPLHIAMNSRANKHSHTGGQKFIN